jgi:hypothetical protein
MKQFKSAGQAQRFLSAHDQINNLFHLLCRADVGEFLVLQLDDLTGDVGLGLGPKDRVEAERFGGLNPEPVKAAIAAAQ